MSQVILAVEDLPDGSVDVQVDWGGIGEMEIVEMSPAQLMVKLMMGYLTECEVLGHVPQKVFHRPTNRPLN